MGLTAISGGSVSALGAPSLAGGNMPDLGGLDRLFPSGGKRTAGADAAERPQRVAAASPEVRVGGKTTPIPEVAAPNHPPERSIGAGVLKGLRSVQASKDTSGLGQPDAPNGPTLKVAARVPGPAERQLAPAGRTGGPEVAGRVVTQPGESLNPRFDDLINQLRQVGNHVVQVAVLSKTVGSFTGSVNKLISSG